jgi:hypothetical protein
VDHVAFFYHDCTMPQARALKNKRFLYAEVGRITLLAGAKLLTSALRVMCFTCEIEWADRIRTAHTSNKTGDQYTSHPMRNERIPTKRLTDRQCHRSNKRSDVRANNGVQSSNTIQHVEQNGGLVRTTTTATAGGYMTRTVTSMQTLRHACVA